MSEWQPISAAPKDGTPILVALHSRIYPELRPERDDLKRWNGVRAVMHHNGLAPDGFDIGWSFAAPVGSGGFPDEWIVGWQPIPASPSDGSNATTNGNSGTNNTQPKEGA